jgi:hypothetical protein
MTKVIAYFDNELDADRAMDNLMKQGYGDLDRTVINPDLPGSVAEGQYQLDPADKDLAEADFIVPGSAAMTSSISGGGLLDGKPGLAPLVDNRDAFGVAGARPRDLLLDAGVPDEELDFFTDAMRNRGVVVIVEAEDDEQVAGIRDILRQGSGRTADE